MFTNALSFGTKRLFSSLSLANGLVLTLMCQFSAPSWADSSKDATLKGDLELKGDANSKAMAASGGSAAPMFAAYYGVTITNNFKTPDPPGSRQEQAFWGNGPSGDPAGGLELTDDAVWVYFDKVTNNPLFPPIYYIPSTTAVCSACTASPCTSQNAQQDINGQCHPFQPISAGQMIQLSALKYGAIFLPTANDGATFNIYTVLYKGQDASVNNFLPVTPTSNNDWITNNYIATKPPAPTVKPLSDSMGNYLDTSNKPYAGVAWALMEISTFPVGRDPNVDLTIINAYFFNQQLKLSGTGATNIPNYGMADSTPCPAIHEGCLFPNGTTEHPGRRLTVLYPKFIMVKTTQDGTEDLTNYAGLYQSYVDQGQVTCSTPFDPGHCAIPLLINAQQTDPNSSNGIFHSTLTPSNSTVAPPMLRVCIENNVGEPNEGPQYVFGDNQICCETLKIDTDIANNRDLPQQQAPVVVGSNSDGAVFYGYGMWGPSGVATPLKVDNLPTGPMQLNVGGAGYDRYLHQLASNVARNKTGYYIDYPQGWPNGTYAGGFAGKTVGGISFRLHVTCEDKQGRPQPCPSSYSPANDIYYGLIIDNIRVYGLDPVNKTSGTPTPQTGVDIAEFINKIAKKKVSGYPGGTPYDVILISGGNQADGGYYGTPEWILGGPDGSAQPGGPCDIGHGGPPANCPIPPPARRAAEGTYTYPSWWQGARIPPSYGSHSGGASGYAAPGQIGIVWRRDTDAVSYFMCDNPEGCDIGCICNNCTNFPPTNPTAAGNDSGWVRFPASGGSTWPLLTSELDSSGQILTGDFNFDGTLRGSGPGYSDRTSENPFANEPGCPAGMSFIKVAANGKILPWTTQYPPGPGGTNQAPIPCGDQGGGKATLPMFGVLNGMSSPSVSPARSLSPGWNTYVGPTVDEHYVPGQSWPGLLSPLAKQIPDSFYVNNLAGGGYLWGVPQLPTAPGGIVCPTYAEFPYVNIVPCVGNWTDDLIASGSAGVMAVMGAITWQFTDGVGAEQTVPNKLSGMYGFDPAQGVRNWPRFLPPGDVMTPQTDQYTPDGTSLYQSVRATGQSIPQRSMGEPWAQWSQGLLALLMGKVSLVLQYGIILPDSWPDPDTTGTQGSAYIFSMYNFKSENPQGPFDSWKPFWLKGSGGIPVGDAYASALFNFMTNNPAYITPYSDALKGLNPNPTLGGPSNQKIEWILGPVATAEPLKSDFDGNGCVGSEDLTLLIANWGVNCGKIPGGCPWDTDSDGLVDGADLNILLGEWGIGGPNCSNP